MKDNYYYNGFNILDKFFKPSNKSVCDNCEFQKKGLETMCVKYKRKPTSVKEFGRCKHFEWLGE